MRDNLKEALIDYLARALDDQRETPDPILLDLDEAELVLNLLQVEGTKEMICPHCHAKIAIWSPEVG